ncbi:hypothetical protein LZ31DRAFT_596838 [Colletotrichum somersetense]|nr:hypothetical protein LZ31DRAFT_596838 [Colletotrichum somersetense]
MPGIKGVALRSMKEPGTAYNDPRFGENSQPAHFKDYVPTFEDNGGVHIYSRIPNRDFCLAAMDFGGFSYEKAGPIWWKDMNYTKEPGTAYNYPRSGKDPQPAHFEDFVPTFEDNGGVHISLEILNRAFYLVAMAFGGFSYEKAGPIWWKAMNSGRILPRCTFLQFADVTTETAEELYDEKRAF